MRTIILLFLICVSVAIPHPLVNHDIADTAGWGADFPSSHRRSAINNAASRRNPESGDPEWALKMDKTSIDAERRLFGEDYAKNTEDGGGS
ncbi:hypothetical protein BKA62DRAFT_357031 [Auriculariales sp. MPI-PUGE-AT-0066]|nr:hypothetical protein BKA62DRAFT_357031 [Auriculariales sp. MPI-PUGE-AT-0066]